MYFFKCKPKLYGKKLRFLRDLIGLDFQVFCNGYYNGHNLFPSDNRFSNTVRSFSFHWNALQTDVESAIIPPITDRDFKYWTSGTRCSKSWQSGVPCTLIIESIPLFEVVTTVMQLHLTEPEFNPFKRQPHKIVKHTQIIHRLVLRSFKYRHWCDWGSHWWKPLQMAMLEINLLWSVSQLTEIIYHHYQLKVAVVGYGTREP